MTKCDTVSEADVLNNRRRAWIHALESGEYPQATGGLFKPGIGYCCIGVALSKCDGEPDYSLRSDDTDYYLQFRDLFHVSPLFADRLINMNDQGNRDFKFIARFLRKVWQISD